MWGYQPHFRLQLELLANQVIAELGVPDSGTECLLVGIKIPGRENPNYVCIEPEDGKWSVDLFDGILDSIEAEVNRHPLQNVFYGDELRMRDKPENIRRDSVCRAVQNALVAYDSLHGVHSFAGQPGRVDDFYVVPVLQLPTAIFQRFRPLPKPVWDGHSSGYASLIHAALNQILFEACNELFRPEPGRSILPYRSAAEIARLAADRFMYTPAIALKDRTIGGSDLFNRINLISSLMYEGTQGTGRILLANPESGSVDLSIRFSDPVPFQEPRWARKVLQMASSENCLVADAEKIFGLGQVALGVDTWSTQDVYEIEFLDHYHWRLTCGEEVMLISRYGFPSLPQEPFPEEQLSDTYERLFSTARPSDLSRFIGLFRETLHGRRGCTLVVAEDASDEAHRLQRQGTRVSPVRLTPELYRQVSMIDGAILLDLEGNCHAVGVILDGAARSDCTPARGSRYNSALRYVRSSNAPRLAVVVSDDQTVDVIPLLRPRIKTSIIQNALVELESATKHDYHDSIEWLHRHRFYLDRDQCDRVNASLKRIASEPLEVGRPRRIWVDFVPDPDFDDSYLVDDDAS